MTEPVEIVLDVPERMDLSKSFEMPLFKVVCPNCNSNDCERIGEEKQDKFLYFKHKCKKCNAEWVSEYRLEPPRRKE